MLEVALGSFDGRDFLNAFRSIEREDGGGAVTPECDSQDFAEETRRLATSAPRFCARAPTT